MSLCLRIVMKALSFLGVANSADITAANRPTLRGLPQIFFSKYTRSARTTLGVFPKNLFFPQVYKVGRVRQVYPRGQPQFFSNSSRSARSAKSVATDFLLITKKDRNWRSVHREWENKTSGLPRCALTLFKIIPMLIEYRILWDHSVWSSHVLKDAA